MPPERSGAAANADRSSLDVRAGDSGEQSAHGVDAAGRPASAVRAAVSEPDSQPDFSREPGTSAEARDSGARVHYRALEGLYAAAPINALFSSRLSILGAGHAQIRFTVDSRLYHAAGAAHGTVYFKMLDDAAFYAANSLVSDRFLLTTGFSLNFTRPVRSGEVVAEGRWISGRRRVFVAEASLIDESGEVIGRGTGTFMRSHIALAGLPGYRLQTGVEGAAE